jgi:hypothetical protein
MNAALARTFADFTETLAKFTREPLATDLFSWCVETDNFPHIRWSLSALGVSFEPSMTVADLRAKIERKLEQERSKKERAHWSYDSNRQVAFAQMVAAIDEFKRSV